MDEYLENEKLETIKIPGSDNSIYENLMKHIPKNYREENFIYNLKVAIRRSIKGFEIFVNDPSLKDGKLSFLPGFKLATGYSYNEWERIAKKNGLRLGTKDEYILFLGWLITSLIDEGLFFYDDAWKAVCTDSRLLGNYCDSTRNTKSNDYLDFEDTGLRKIVGKCDLGNSRKILAKDKEYNLFWIAGSTFIDKGSVFPLASMEYSDKFERSNSFGVGWLVK